MSAPGNRILKLVLLGALLYAFLTCIAMMGAAFKLLGKDITEALITSTSNPVVGLMIGMLSTAIIQSSSTTTSIIVSLVAAGALTVANGIPMIMGANIGTSVTNTMVALTAIRRREEFRRSFAGATMHDFFNLLSVVILFPLEQVFHILERGAGALADLLVGAGEVEFDSPVKTLTKPLVNAFVHVLQQSGLSETAAGVAALLVALIGIFLALSQLPRIMKDLFLSRAEGALLRVMSRGGLGGIAVGTIVTMLVQSSSITTSLLVPMIGAGILPLEGAFAITLGANVGTTITGLLASTAGTHDAVSIALVHLLFNLIGIAIIYPVRAIRMIPIFFARKLADLSIASKAVPVLYLLFVFFLLPGIIIVGQRLLSGN